MRDLILDQLEPYANLPTAGRNEWLGASEEGVQFLTNHYAADSEIILYASGRYALAQTVLAPLAAVMPPDKEDLSRSWLRGDDSWTIERSWSGGPEPKYNVELRPPLNSPGCNSLVGGEQLVFRRALSGVHKGPTPIELSQKLVHALDIYFQPERNAYCRLDSRGDIEDVIKIHRRKGHDDWHDMTAVTIRARDLHEFMALTETALFVKFDFTRTSPGGFSSWGGDQTEVDIEDCFYHGCSMPGHASYSNGYLIVRPKLTRGDLIEAFRHETEFAEKSYATFKFFDRKNNRLVESQIGPGNHVSYFEDSELPWDISPVFFRAEVLQRFKADPEKYHLDERSVSCRNAWSLETFDINEAGQVHTYLIYLSRLPYEEQLYWQAFNEWPKSGISKRAFTTDILGNWDDDYDPMLSLKLNIEKLDKAAPDWWNPRAKELHESAKYPVTDSIAEWGNEILALDQLVVEGFQKKGLAKLATKNGVTIDKEWGTLKLLEVVLPAMGMTESGSINTVAPLRKLHSIRNPAKAHGDPGGRERVTKEARTEHGNLRAHIRALAAGCDTAIETITAVINGSISTGE